MPTCTDFANCCCDLLASAGRCVAKRMFGGYALGTDGLTMSILADLGDGEKLWLKGDDSVRCQYEAAGYKIFIYPMRGAPRSMHYFSNPEERRIHPTRCSHERRLRSIVLCGHERGSVWSSLKKR